MSQLGGLRAYVDRLGKDLSPYQSRHSVASGIRRRSSPLEERSATDDAERSFAMSA